MNTPSGRIPARLAWTRKSRRTLTGVVDVDQPLPVPHVSKFYLIDEKTNIRLSGVPDTLFRCRDNSYCILDFKTARWSESQEALIPLYSVQVQSYAWIASAVGYSPVSKVGLIYFEMQRLSDLAGEFEMILLSDGFQVQFCARFLDIILEPETILPSLFEKVRALYDLAEPPPSASGCTECQMVDRLISQLSPGT